jgi:CRISPR-associated protein Csx14
MNMPVKSVFIATLGAQPQVVTLALDTLLAQGEQIDETIVVHLSGQTERFPQALRELNHEFSNNCYAGRPMRYRAIPISYNGNIVKDIQSDLEADAVFDTFHNLLPSYKQQEKRIHLCATGGRRLLGMLALSAAQFYFAKTDRVWHLYSSDRVRELSNRGACLHVDAPDEIQLIQVPLQTWGHMLPWLRGEQVISAKELRATNQKRADQSEFTRCQTVINRLTQRPRDVLREIALGSDPQAVAQKLKITVNTVHTHKKVIFEECINAWGLPQGEKLRFHWLRERFMDYYAAEDPASRQLGL